MRRLAAITTLVAVAGCNSFYDVDVAVVTPPPASVTVTEEVRFSEGTAFTGVVVPRHNRDPMDTDTVIEIESSDPAVVTVDQTDLGIEDCEAHPSWQSRFSGHAVGSATLFVTIDGEHEGSIDVVVEPQRIDKP